MKKYIVASIACLSLLVLYKNSRAGEQPPATAQDVPQEAGQQQPRAQPAPPQAAPALPPEIAAIIINSIFSTIDALKANQATIENSAPSLGTISIRDLYRAKEEVKRSMQEVNDKFGVTKVDKQVAQDNQQLQQYMGDLLSQASNPFLSLNASLRDFHESPDVVAKKDQIKKLETELAVMASQYLQTIRTAGDEALRQTSALQDKMQQVRTARNNNQIQLNTLRNNPEYIKAMSTYKRKLDSIQQQEEAALIGLQESQKILLRKIKEAIRRLQLFLSILIDTEKTQRLTLDDLTNLQNSEGVS